MASYTFICGWLTISSSIIIIFGVDRYITLYLIYILYLYLEDFVCGYLYVCVWSVDYKKTRCS